MKRNYNWHRPSKTIDVDKVVKDVGGEGSSPVHNIVIQLPIKLVDQILKYCEDQQIYDKLDKYDDFYYKLKMIKQSV